MLSFTFLSNLVQAQESVVKGYYMYWSKSTLSPSQLPWNDLTHVAHAFIWPAEDGSLVTEQANHPELIQEAHRNDVEIIISVGGWGQSDAFPEIASDSTLRAKFITNLTNYVLQHEYDGVDLDWEYPSSADRNNVTKLIREMHAAFEREGRDIGISIALPSVDWKNGYDLPAILDYVEWLGVMTYDFHGSWTDRGGHNSPLYAPQNANCNTGSIDQSIRYYLQKGVPANKLLAGLASYGRIFNSSVICGQSSSGNGNGGSISYADALNRLENGWSYHWDDKAKAPWLQNVDSTQIISFDDTTSYKVKREYIRSKDLRGAMVWALGFDKTDNGHELMNILGDLNRTSTFSEIEKRTESPEEFVLMPNYPNPFNPVTNITYKLQQPGEVKLLIFNSVGQIVQKLVTKKQPAGVYTVRFDGEGMSSGVYMYQLVVNGQSEIQKMTLIK